MTDGLVVKMIFMRTVRPRLAVLLAVLAPVAAPADSWFHFDPLRLEAEIRFDGYRRETEGELDEQGYQFEERLLLRQEGHVIDPRIGRFSLQFEPINRNGNQEIPGDDDDSNGSDLNYNFTLSALQGAEAPLDAYLSAVRATQVNDVAFSNRYETDVSNNTLLVNWKNDFFPLRFLFSDKSLEETVEQLGVDVRRRRDEDRERYVVSGRSSKMEVNFDRLRVDDHIAGDERDYKMDRARVNHVLRWGRGSALRSVLALHDRSGFNPYKNVSLTEISELRHSDTVTSLTSYRYFKQDTGLGTDDVTQDGTFELRHEPYENLLSTARVNGRARSSELLKQDEYAFGGRTNYRKSDLFGLTVGAGLNANWRVTDRVSQGGTLDVVDEPYPADFVTPIILGQRFADPDSVLVAAAADGFVYSAGLDYTVAQFGGQFTEIRILPSGQIDDGEALLISYLYELQPSAEYDTLSTGYALSLGFKGFRLYHNANRSDNSQRSGEWEYLPPDERYVRTGLEWNWFNPSMRVRLGVESTTREIAQLVSDSLVFTQSLTWNLTDKMELMLSGHQAFTRSRGLISIDPRIDEGLQIRAIDSEFYTFNAALTWRPRSSLTVRPSLGVWRRTEENQPVSISDIDRRNYSAKLIVTWYLRQLFLDFRYNFNARDLNGTDYTENRLMMTVRRTFR